MLIEQPIMLRKEILSAAIDATKLLKDYEEFVALKNKKLKTLRYLHREMKEIKRLSKEFNEDRFPVIPHEEVHAKKSVVKKVEEPKPEVVKPVKVATKKSSTEVDRLNDELREIEEKLGRL